MRAHEGLRAPHAHEAWARELRMPIPAGLVINDQLIPRLLFFVWFGWFGFCGAYYARRHDHWSLRRKLAVGTVSLASAAILIYLLGFRVHWYPGGDPS